MGKLSHCLDCPTQAHYTATLCVLKYLKQSPATGLFFATSSNVSPTGFSDADWAVCLDTRRSVTGYCFYLGSSLISWKSKKQPTVARSSSEAEYRTLTLAVCEAQWISFILADLHLPVTKPIPLYCDSQSALYIAAIPVFHERTKHIEVDCHVVRERESHFWFIEVASDFHQGSSC
ncbi:secreted RxLR effector protein 161-like [Arachis hypogaea]|uniref:secreted RxLR effector protein 161-like n=1 Tax=Arachis hypogaea TaxID=3818 RepID=UPI003B210484